MRLPFENGRRRRIYLMRHAQAAYFDDAGARRPEPNTVPLTPKGRQEALAMADWLAPVPFDRAICSGLPRTEETASIVLGGRELTLEHAPGLKEIQGAGLEERAALDPSVYAYAMFRAGEPDARFAAGERFADFQTRVLPAFMTILQDTAWTNLLLVCHGGTNRAILTWFLGLGLDTFGQFEQDSCCLNILDFDQLDVTGMIVRRIIRAVNMTAYDTAKTGSSYLSMEGLAHQHELAKAVKP
ncbi:phosphoglycerate mutase GpmB [Alphaproteobacteria bacterium SO-S41]|nr:phosphoglycerate mutase GpmB [Alphaproteobacteria bacterium SO-S41]